jgi:galactonate dehydratase
MKQLHRRKFIKESVYKAGGAVLLPGTVLSGTSAGNSMVNMSSKMKIMEARIYQVSIGGRYPVIIKLMTDQGISGIGEAALAYGTGTTAAVGMLRDLVQQFLPEKDPFSIEALWSEMYDHTFWAKGGGPIVFAGISAIEQALWDIKGKALGVPVYELLGGKMRDKIRVYANGWSFRCTKPEEFAREAERVVKDGYTAIKFYPLATAEMDEYGKIRHVSHRTIDKDAENRAIASVKAVRDAVGSEIDVLLDMSAELTPDAIISIGRKLEDMDIFFLEEPVDPFDEEGLKKVSDQVHIPIATGERIYTRYGFRRIFELRAADIIQPDLGNTGGIMEGKKIAAMAEAYNMRIQPHNCGSPVLTAASLQLDANIPNFIIQETYPYRIPEHFQIVDRAPELEISNSFVPISDRPGLGIELVEKLINPFLAFQIKLNTLL